ncbi:alginate export family protein [Robertkochia solimangrovi]|uniref:alginate export family protein n=1 Tax=Robertkochia solimangrovi TaxID=2213046 RepID=UPI001181353D|nr:alginate export family protein [Robertkochia solimangrovi]TRZ42035.1 hypothetical protein DMZ48_15485 [Robertkochia solimangrovi]
MTRYFLLIITLVCVVSQMKGQEFKMDLDFRDRFEYRHGFSTLFPDDADPAAFVRQRARLNLDYQTEWLEAYLSVQDISTWGDTRQILAADDNHSFMLFQAWVGISIGQNWGLKAGRQVISYDNQRILGGLDWAMQGRFHDALLIKYLKNDFLFDLGFAFSQQNEPVIGTGYDITGFFTYKTMQYGYFKKVWNKSVTSFLFMNNGFQAYTGENNDIPDGTYNMQTTGVFFNFPAGNFSFEGNVYYQFGKASKNTDLSAYDLALEVGFKPGSTLFAIGYEMLSGTDQTGESKSHSFFPLYGTNHKFNGYMDYFYVGNHANNVGLNDLYGKIMLKPGVNNSLLIKAHYFSSNAELTDDADKYLGTEVDVVFTQKLMNNVNLNVGYSHMFAGDSMSLIKGGAPTDNTNNWFYLQLNVDPVLFTHTF